MEGAGCQRVIVSLTEENSIRRLVRHRSCQCAAWERQSSLFPVVLNQLVRDTGQHLRKAHWREDRTGVGLGRDEKDVGVRSSNCGVA